MHQRWHTNRCGNGWACPSQRLPRPGQSSHERYGGADRGLLELSRLPGEDFHHLLGQETESQTCTDGPAWLNLDPDGLEIDRFELLELVGERLAELLFEVGKGSWPFGVFRHVAELVPVQRLVEVLCREIVCRFCRVGIGEGLA